MPRCLCLPCEHRWEIVARMHVPGAAAATYVGADGREHVYADARPPRSWIVPLSEGRHFRASRIAARWTAWKWTRRARRAEDPTLTGVRMTWEVRQTPTAVIRDLLEGAAVTRNGHVSIRPSTPIADRPRPEPPRPEPRNPGGRAWGPWT